MSNLEIPYDLHLGFDREGIVDSEAFQNLVELHELLPAPVVLLLAESMERVCIHKASLKALSMLQLLSCFGESPKI